MDGISNDYWYDMGKYKNHRTVKDLGTFSS